MREKGRKQDRQKNVAKHTYNPHSSLSYNEPESLLLSPHTPNSCLRYGQMPLKRLPPWECLRPRELRVHRSHLNTNLVRGRGQADIKATWPWLKERAPICGGCWAAECNLAAPVGAEVNDFILMGITTVLSCGVLWNKCCTRQQRERRRGNELFHCILMPTSKHRISANIMPRTQEHIHCIYISVTTTPIFEKYFRLREYIFECCFLLPLLFILFWLAA